MVLNAMVPKWLTLLRQRPVLEFLLASEAAPLLAALVFLAVNGHGLHGPELGWPDSPLFRWAVIALYG